MFTSNTMRMLLTTVVLVVTCACGSATAGTVTWTGGASDGSWQNGKNWSGGKVPSSADDAVIPPNSGTITTGSAISVNSLDVQDSMPPGTTITGKDPGDDVEITAKEDMNIGKDNTLAGKDGKNNKPGGDVKVTSRNGNVTNKGKLKGGKGDEKKRGGNVTAKNGTVTNDGGMEGGEGGPSSGNTGGTGGSVQVTGDDVINNGEEKGGDAGKVDDKPKGKGGNVTNKAAKKLKMGTKKGGKPAGTGRVSGSGAESVMIMPGDIMEGASVSISTSPAGVIVMAGLPPLSIMADEGVFIDAGDPFNVIDLTGVIPGENVIVATEQVCIRGEVMLDPGVSLADITEPDAFLSIDPCVAPNVPWMDDFEAYPAEMSLHGMGGWKGWDNDPAGEAFTTDFVARGGTISLDVAAATDLVHEYEGCAAGKWSYTAWQYIPSDFSSNGSGQFAGSYFILLNRYADGGPHEDADWSLQMNFDSNDGMLKVYYGNGMNTVDVPYEPERWVKIQATVDLDDDWTRVYYDDALIAEYSWTGGVLGGGGGALDIAALDLYANDSTSIFYDDARLVPIVIGDLSCDGLVDFGDINPYVQALTDPDGWEAEYPWCDIMNGDINDDGLVDFGDINPFVSLLTNP